MRRTGMDSWRKLGNTLLGPSSLTTGGRLRRATTTPGSAMCSVERPRAWSSRTCRHFGAESTDRKTDESARPAGGQAREWSSRASTALPPDSTPMLSSQSLSWRKTYWRPLVILPSAVGVGGLRSRQGRGPVGRQGTCRPGEQALDWLLQDLTWCGQRLDDGNAHLTPGSGRVCVFGAAIRTWPECAKDALATLPGEERERWKRLWSDVDTLLLRVSAVNEMTRERNRDIHRDRDQQVGMIRGGDTRRTVGRSLRAYPGASRIRLGGSCRAPARCRTQWRALTRGSPVHERPEFGRVENHQLETPLVRVKASMAVARRCATAARSAPGTNGHASPITLLVSGHAKTKVRAAPAVWGLASTGSRDRLGKLHIFRSISSPDTECLRLPQINVELAQLSINHDLLVRLDVGHPVRDEIGRPRLLGGSFRSCGNNLASKARQQVERDDGGPFAQIERGDVALFNRDQPLYAVLGTLARESLTRSGSMSKPRALQAYSSGRRTEMRPSPQPRSQTTSLLVTLASRSSASTTFCGVGSYSTSVIAVCPARAGRSFEVAGRMSIRRVTVRGPFGPGMIALMV